MLKTLINLGFEQRDAEVYIFLSEMGPQRGKVLADALKMPKHQLDRSLKNLRSRDMVNTSSERPARFSAVPLEKVIDSLIEAKKEQALTLQESKEKLLSNWRTKILKDSSDS
jgi:sugar-specific transcriptional regulator TrmB